MKEAAEVEITASVVKLSEGTMRYLEAGSGEPVVFLHGAGALSGGEGWLQILEGLAGEFRVLALDFFGFGGSDHLSTPSTFGSMADNVREFQDVLELGPCAIVGASMGGRVATILGYESPSRLTKLVMLAPGGAAADPKPAAWGSFPSAADVAQALDRVKGYAFATDEMAKERLRLYADPSRAAAFDATMAELMSPASLLRFNTIRRLPYVTTETLLLWGMADQRNPIEMGHTMAALMPNVRLQTLEDAGHALASERPEEVTVAIAEFLGSGTIR